MNRPFVTMTAPEGFFVPVFPELAEEVEPYAAEKRGS